MSRGNRVAVVLAFFLSTAAHGATLQWAGTREWVGVLKYGDLSGTGVGVAEVSLDEEGFLNGLRFLSSGLDVSASVQVTDPLSAPLVTVTMTARLIPGTLTKESLQLPLGGHMKMCLLFKGCENYLSVPLATTYAGVGMGGVITVNAFSHVAAQRLSIVGAPWTLGIEHLDDGKTIYGKLYPQDRERPGISIEPPKGTIQVVSSVDLVGASGDSLLPTGKTPLWMTFRFVPEPGIGLLLLSGIAGLWAISRQRGL